MVNAMHSGCSGSMSINVKISKVTRPDRPECIAFTTTSISFIESEIISRYRLYKRICPL